MEKLYLILSFDYELPLSGSESYDIGLFNQADKILKISASNDYPISLFADILNYVRFKEWNIHDFIFKFEEQINFALNNGHDVQLHIHPQWIDTKYENNRFYPPVQYALSDYANDENNSIESIISLSYNELTELCNKFDSDYKCIAFRAGGLSLYPNTDRILKSLFNSGIRIDSTICKGYYWVTSQQNVNFRNMPKSSNWLISLNGPLNKISDNGIFEIPIACKPKNFITNFPTRFKKRKFIYRAYDCKALPWPYIPKTSLINKFLYTFTPRVLGFDFYYQNLNDLLNILDYNFKKYKNQNIVYLSSMSHPKLMGDYSINLMNEFVKSARKKYKNQIEFITYKDAFKLIGIT